MTNHIERPWTSTIWLSKTRCIASIELFSVVAQTLGTEYAWTVIRSKCVIFLSGYCVKLLADIQTYIICIPDRSYPLLIHLLINEKPKGVVKCLPYRTTALISRLEFIRNSRMGCKYWKYTRWHRSPSRYVYQGSQIDLLNQAETPWRFVRNRKEKEKKNKTILANRAQAFDRFRQGSLMLKVWNRYSFLIMLSVAQSTYP